jgi:hypothetical protein
MGVIENAKEVAELIKQYNNIELNRKIINLEREIADLQSANRKLEDELIEAKSDLAKRAAMHYRAPYYWQDGDETPFCAKCWEGKDNLPVHLPAPERVFAGIVRKCHHCKTDFWEERFKPQQHQVKRTQWS